MSYILDALRKSERERRLGNIPTLVSVHGVPRRSDRQSLMWFGIGLSVAALGVFLYFAGGWLLNSARESIGDGRARITPPPAAPVSQSPVAGVPAPSPSPARSLELSITAPERDTQADTNSLPEMLSAITVNVVSYSDDPERRFIMVDQKIYKEGDSLMSGAVIENISVDGPIVQYQGQRFLLRP